MARRACPTRFVVLVVVIGRENLAPRIILVLDHAVGRRHRHETAAGPGDPEVGIGDVVVVRVVVARGGADATGVVRPGILGQGGVFVLVVDQRREAAVLVVRPLFVLRRFVNDAFGS